MDKNVNEAIMYLADRLNVSSEVSQILCSHSISLQVDEDCCRCRLCGKILILDERKKFLDSNWGKLSFLDGTWIGHGRPC